MLPDRNAKAIITTIIIALIRQAAKNVCGSKTITPTTKDSMPRINPAVLLMPS